MNTKMKGVLKGLRYISQIFEPNGKEQEMQIGYPTDVKHVAHIGWDGPSVNPPSWMNEFRSAPLSSLGTDDFGGDVTPTRFASHDFNEEGSPDLLPPKPSRRNRSAPESQARPTPLELPARDLPELPLPRPSRRQAPTRAVSADASYNDPSSSPAGVSRRVRSSEVSPVGSPASNPADRCPPRQARRQSRPKEPRSGGESPTMPDQPPSIPRQSRRKKSANSKGSYGDGGSTRSKALAEAGQSETARMEEKNHEGLTATEVTTTAKIGEANNTSSISLL